MRRSSRANKGQHSKREIELFLEDEEDILPQKKRLSELSKGGNHKKAKVANDNDDDYDYQDDGEEKIEDNLDEEGDVRCSPCGTNKDNYDEDKDEGGMMIECELCKTWQHAKCMGYKSADLIPKSYKCDLCSTGDKKKGDKTIAKKSSRDDYSIESRYRNKTRSMVAKAFAAVFEKNIPSTYEFPEGLDKSSLSSKWGIELENAIASIISHNDKKYTDKSRSLISLIKKPNVMSQIIDGDLSFQKLVNSSPEEIDNELKEYAEKVRQESIRRSVLTAEDNGQRIRRTHKGEEIVEDLNTNQEEVDVNILTRNIDHRRFQDEKENQTREVMINKEDNKVYNNYNPSFATSIDDDEEEEEGGSPQHNEEEEVDHSHSFEEAGDNGSAEIPDLDDKELDFILKDDKEKVIEKPKEVKLPPVMSSEIWSGDIVFPDFVSFKASGLFYTCSNYKKPDSAPNVKLFNKYVRISKELLSRNVYQIEGKLDRRRADDYLNKIVATRDIFLIEIKCEGNFEDYDRLTRYFAEKGKVGVLSNKPKFVKDSYLLNIDGNDPYLPDYLLSVEKIRGKKGLFALYVVQKDYSPAPVSILKTKSSNTTSAPTENMNSNHQEGRSAPLLDSILNKLGNNNPGNMEGSLLQNLNSI